MSGIIRLQSENVKRLTAVSITPDQSDPLVVIGGRNGQGKSSVLDSIQMALGGKDAVPSKPVRNGQEKARVVLELPDMTIERRFSPSGESKLIVKSKDGATFPSPQKMLDSLTAKLCFDPLAFLLLGNTAEGRRKQAEILRGAYGLDFSKEDATSKKAFDERTMLSRDLKAVTARLEAMPEPLSDTPDAEVSVSELMQKLNAAQAHNKQADEMAARAAKLAKGATDERARVDAIKAQIAHLTEEIKHLHDQIAGCLSIIRATEQDISALDSQQKSFALADVDGLQKQITESAAVNARVAAKKAKQELADHVRDLTNKVAAQSGIIDRMAASKAAKLKAAKFPIEGLSVTDDGVTLNDIPLDQASSAEALRLSVAIGLAQNPKLKVLLVRDGSLLDKRSMRLLAEMAADADAQVWVEVVSEGEECTVVIDDGAVKE